MSTLYFRFAARSLDEPRRAPLLERLVARAGKPLRVADWRAEALRVIAPGAHRPPGVAAAFAAERPADAASAAWVCVATPVHFSAGMRGVTLPPDGVLRLAPDEAAALAADFNRTFGNAGARLSAARDALACWFDQPVDAVTHDPESMAGNDVFGFQPAGPDAPRLRRLMSEWEMWLFDHPANRLRAAQGRPPITGLWLWGGASTAAALPTVLGWCAGRDPLFSAFGNEPGYPSKPGSGVVACDTQPGAEEWPDIERRWLMPAAAALRSGGLTRLALSAADRSYVLGRGSIFRIWRRTRPWWESYGME